MELKYPLYEMTIDGEMDGIYRISLVDDPAVESFWHAFSKAKEQVMFKLENEEQRMVTGVVMRADFPILRVNEFGEYYYVIYSKETIKVMAEKLLADNNQNRVNLMHMDGTELKSVLMTEIFIKDSSKGISPAGFEEIEEGSLFATFKVENDEIWDEIKKGTFKGFSLEGYFTPKEVIKNKLNKESTVMSKLKNILKRLLQEYGALETDKGLLEWDGELEVGKEVTIDGEPAADGDYLGEGKLIVVAEGKVAEIKDVEPEAPEEEVEDNTEEVEAEEEVVIETEPENVEEVVEDVRDLEAEVDQLRRDLEILRNELEALKNKPENEPIVEQFEHVEDQKKKNSRAERLAAAFKG